MRYLREFYLTANFFLNITGVSEQPFENVLEIPHWWWVSTDRKDKFLKANIYYWDMYNNQNRIFERNWPRKLSLKRQIVILVFDLIRLLIEKGLKRTFF